MVSGVKPTGRLHLGNLEGALRAWVALQASHETFCLIADWHAYTTEAASASPGAIREATRQVAAEIVAAGLDPGRAALFRQSEVKEHAELYLLLGMVTPVSWLDRVPTWKELRETESSPGFGLFGYPLLQAADVLLYRARAVPVGRDQLPHLELAHEIARRFNQRFGAVFPEPEAVIGEVDVLPGLDGKKMSKSRGNVIWLADSEEETARKIMSAYTTPTKLRATDPGEPEGCVVCRWRRVYDPAGWRASWEEDRAGLRGCVRNKLELVERVNAALAPLRRRLRALEAEPGALERILADGAERARAAAAATMREVRAAMRLG